MNKKKPFWELGINPILMYKYESYSKAKEKKGWWTGEYNRSKYKINKLEKQIKIKEY